MTKEQRKGTTGPEIVLIVLVSLLIIAAGAYGGAVTSWLLHRYAPDIMPFMML